MKIKILQWNIWYKEDLKKISDLIKSLNPDVMCLQELIQDKKNNFDAPFALSKLLSKKYSYYYKEAASWDFKSGVTGQGNGIFSKYQIIDQKYNYITRFKHNPKNASDEGRIYQEVCLNINGKNIFVGTTHLSFTVNLEIDKSREDETNNLIKILKDHKSGFIFTGDLNAVPGSYVLNQIKNLDTLVSAGPDFDKKTWPSKKFDYHGLFKIDKIKYRIDYVFVTKDLKVLSSEIIDTDVSDHRPILTTLEV